MITVECVQYRSKPSLVEAIQWNGSNLVEVRAFMDDDPEIPKARLLAGDLRIRAGVRGAQGWVTVPVDHWIVRKPGDSTDIWPVDPDYFEEKYEVNQ